MAYDLNICIIRASAHVIILCMHERLPLVAMDMPEARYYYGNRCLKFASAKTEYMNIEGDKKKHRSTKYLLDFFIQRER